MATTVTDKTLTMFNEGGNELSNIQNKEYFERKLLDTLKSEPIILRFGQPVKMPKNSGNILTWRKLVPMETVEKPLTEGVTPEPSTFGYTQYKMSVEQYGQYAEYTDELADLSIDDVVGDLSRVTAEAGAKSINKLTIKELYKSPNVFFSKDVLTVDDLLYLHSVMRKNNVKPYEDNKYVLLCSEEQAYDLQREATAKNSWLEVNKYADPSKIIDGEIGSIVGWKIIASNDIETSTMDISKLKEIYGDEISTEESNSAFQCSRALALGYDSFKYVSLEGDSAGSPKLIVKGLGAAGTADPLNQKGTVGWKNYFGARINYDEAVMQVITKTSVIIPEFATVLPDDKRTHYMNKTPGKMTAGDYKPGVSE